jgi:hypothetical protein
MKCRCGDKVKIETKTEGFDDGMVIPHNITRPPAKTKGRKKKGRMHVGKVAGKVKGNKCEVEWVSKHGPWRKPPTKFKITAVGKGGPKHSSELEIEIPSEVPKEEIGKSPNKQTRIKVVKKLVRAVGPPDLMGRYPTIYETKIKEDKTKFWWNDYKIELSITKGRFRVLCKIKLNDLIKSTLPAKKKKHWPRKLKKLKKGWKKIID